MKYFHLLFILLSLCSTSVFALEPEVAVSVNQAGEAFVVDVALDVAVPLATAWEVMTDFDHMTTFLSNLTASRIVKRDGQTLTVRQEGVAKYGLFSYAFESEREIHLESLKHILVKQLSGTAKHFGSDARLNSTTRGTHVEYRAEIVPDSALARMFGAPIVRREVTEQFRAMAAEMLKRGKKVNESNAIPQ